MGRISFRKFIKDQIIIPPPPVSEYRVDLTGRTVVVVGANIGLGLETTRHFARMNPKRLIMACRDMGRAQTALKGIHHTTGCPNLEAWHIDLADFKSVRAFAAKYEKKGYGHLDLLVMNAGVQLFNYKQTVDHWELQLQTNHLGTSYLTLLLLPYLKKSPISAPTPRIVIVSSEAHYFVKRLEEADSPHIMEKLNDKQYSSISNGPLDSVMLNRYHVTKLFNIFFTRSLASRLPTPSSIAPGLTVTCVNPGWCKSNLNRDNKWSIPGFIVVVLYPIFARSAKVGSRTIIWAALAGKDSGGEIHGKYTATCRVEEESDYALSDDGRRVEDRVWKETIDILKNIDPNVEAIIREHLADRV